MKRLLIVISAMLAVLLAACGGVGDSDAPTPTQPIPFDPESLGDPPGPSNPFDPAAGTALPNRTVPGFVPSITEPETYLTDFSGLGEADFGQLVGLDGIVSIVSPSDTGLVSADIQDANGVVVRVLMPAPLINQADGQQVKVYGTLNAGEDGLLVLNSASISRDNPNISSDLNTILVGPNAITGEPPQSTTAVPPPFLQQPNQTLDFTLDANLTALQAYDALQSVLGTELTGWTWILADGLDGREWTFYFTPPSDGVSSGPPGVTGRAYTVMADGTVSIGPNSQSSLPGVVNLPLDRASIVVDSDIAARDLLADQPQDGATVLILRAEGSQDGNTQTLWSVAGTDITPIDATTSR